MGTCTHTLLKSKSAFLNPRETLMGTSDIKSTPPATTTSDWPEAIWLTPTQTHAHKLNTLSLRTCYHQYRIMLLMGLTTCTKQWDNKNGDPVPYNAYTCCNSHVRRYTCHGDCVAWNTITESGLHCCLKGENCMSGCNLTVRFIRSPTDLSGNVASLDLLDDSANYNMINLLCR